MNKSIAHLLSPISEFANQSFWKVFWVVGTLNLFSTLIYNHLVWSDLVYLNESGLNSSDQVFIDGSVSRLKVNLIVDILSPLWLLGKAGLVAGLIYIIAYIIQVEISLKEITKSILTSYLFIVFGDLIYSLILLLFDPPLFKIDILHFYPLSFLSFLNSDSDLNEYYTIWSRINFFQLLFIFSLYYLFRSQHSLNSKNSLVLTLSYVFFYGLFLVLWLLFSI